MPLLHPYVPRISIILPTYNRATYLDQCIASVVAQTYQDWELVVVDDGSDDQSFERVKSWVDRCPQIRYLYQPNRGAGLARNAGIQAAWGDWITFIDSDDHYLPEHLHSRWQWMQEHPEVDLVQGGLFTSEDIWVVDFFNPTQKINLKDCVVCPTFFGSRHVFETLGGFRALAYGEDTDLWQRAEQQFHTAHLHSPATYVYTRASDSTSLNWDPQPPST